MSVSVSNKVVSALAVSVVALAGLGWLAYHTTTQLVKTGDLVTHTHQVIARLADGRAEMIEAETAQRAFLLTGDEAFLKDSRAAQEHVRIWTGDFEKLIADNQQQREKLAELQALIARRFTILNHRIALRQEKGLEASATAVATREGKLTMDLVLAKFGEMHQAEEALLAGRTQVSRASATSSIAVLTLGTGLACVVALGALVTIRRDLRARLVAENELQRTRTLLEAILDNTPAVIFLKDLAGRYLFVNRRMAELSNLPKQALVGKTAFDLYPRAFAEATDKHQRQILEKEAPIEVEETVQYPDGPHPHQAIKFPVRDASGNIYGVAGVSTDISERKRNERMHLQFRSMFESLPGLYLVLTRDFKIVAVSDAYLAATMTKREEILDRGLFEVFPDDPNAPEAHATANLRASLERVLATGKPDTMAVQEYPIRRPDGTFEQRFWSPINSAVLSPEGKVEYLLHRVEDVTEFVLEKQKANPEAREKLQTKLERMEADIFRSTQQIQAANQQLVAANQELESFSHSVSHDLRAPLRHIDGFVDLLRKSNAEQLDARGKRYLDVIAKAARQMGQLIDDLLVFSRTSRTEMSFQNVDTVALTREVIAGLETDIGQRQIKWHIAPLPAVHADRAMLRQVFANLIGNAVKYSRPREVAEIEIGARNGTPGEITFFVRDNGVGFDMQYANKLFGVFQRLHRADEFEGTGIGLANVRRIVNRHGGHTWAESQLGQGTTVYFSLPSSTHEHATAETHPPGGGQ